MERRRGGCKLCFTCEKVGPQGMGHQMQGRMQRGGPKRWSFIAPRNLTVYPTNLCNLRCKYCFVYLYEREFGDTDIMTFETAKRMLDWYAIVSTSPEISLHWFGGEPLVAFDLIKKATEYGDNLMKGTGKTIRWGVTSNMTLINDEVNEFLKKYNYNVLCSIDGLEEDHNKNRIRADGSDSWDDAIAGLDRVLSWNNQRTIRWTISPDTGKTIIDGTKWYFDEKKVPIIAHEFVYETEWKKGDIYRIEKKFESLIPYIVENFKNGRKLDIKVFRDGLRAYTLNMRMPDRCGLAKGDMGVDVDGNFFACHRFVDQKEHFLGNIWEGIELLKIQKLQMGWNQQKILPWSGDREDCVGCPGFLACNGGCLAVNFDTTGNIFKVPKTHCDILNMKVRLAGKLRKELIKEKLFGKFVELEPGRRGNLRCVE